MRSRSISQRVYRAILAISVVNIVAMVGTVWIVNEDLEQTMLHVEFAQERDYIISNHASDDVLVWDTPSFAIVYIPNGKPRPSILPAMFRGLPDADYSAEIEVGKETYLVSIRRVETGMFYIAKSITHFEEREALFNIALFVMAIVILAFSLLLATLSSRRVVRPLRQLSENISRIPVGRNMPRLDSDYSESELQTIAATFNRFLNELESYVHREQSLLSLASHELRTPIAVMSGALDIIEARGQLRANDATTFKRLRRACDEMRDNIDVLLRLSRQAPDGQHQQYLGILSSLQRVIEDLKATHEIENRVQLTVQSDLWVKADPTMVHMLLRNLIQNAVQHTKNDIHVRLSCDAIEIEDYGAGMDISRQEILRGERRLALDGSTLNGLGLYIVTLMIERLDWQLTIARTDHNGTLIRVTPRQSARP